MAPNHHSNKGEEGVTGRLTRKEILDLLAVMVFAFVVSFIFWWRFIETIVQPAIQHLLSAHP